MPNSRDRSPRPWWETAVLYQVYPRSFADGNGDGVGDLRGIAAHLDHVASLGAAAVWLSPIFPSPQRDFGYDVADYCDVDPTYGTLEDLDALVAAAHERGLRVLLDLVPNHTSSDHPWFVESSSSRTNPKRDWYVWSDGRDGGPPNNWIATFTGGGPAWTFHEPTGQWYLHNFLPEQPDLNWENPDVVEAMHDAVRFWLDRGVDGFRVDVAHCIGKELDVDDPPEVVDRRIQHSLVNDVERTHDHLRGLRRVFDEYGDRLVLGEVFLLDTTKVVRYVRPDELHLGMNFPFTLSPWDAGVLRDRITSAYELHDPIGAWPTWVLSNHDLMRHRSRYGGSEDRARAAAVLLLTLRGTPILYHGEELGLEEAVIPPDRKVDPGNRDGCRAPVPWTASPPHGWVDPWLPLPPNPELHNVEAQGADPHSVLSLYRRLLATRNASPALNEGSFAWLPAPDGVLAYERAHDGERWWVVVNLGDGAAEVVLPGAAQVVVSSRDPAEPPFELNGPVRLRGDSAVLLRALV
jgi:alpha-glucosidase